MRYIKTLWLVKANNSMSLIKRCKTTIIQMITTSSLDNLHMLPGEIEIYIHILINSFTSMYKPKNDLDDYFGGGGNSKPQKSNKRGGYEQDRYQGKSDGGRDREDDYD